MRTCIGIAATLLACAQGLALAQSPTPYPTKSVRLVVPLPPGSGMDLISRPLAVKLTEAWGQQVVVDNRPGASTIIGTEFVAKAPPDGHTIVMASNNHATNPALFPKLPFDPVKDFAAIGQIAFLPYVLVVHPSVPAGSVKELVAVARAKPGQLSYASTGNGSPPHLAGELLKLMAKVDLNHVPYKGSPAALTDVIGGQVGVMFVNTLSAMQYVRAGRLRAVAVSTPNRIAIVPEIPTVSESGYPGFDVSVWAGLLAPAGTPRDVLTKISRETIRILDLPDIKERFAAEGAVLSPTGPDQFGAFVAAEIDRLGRIVRAARMRAD